MNHEVFEYVGVVAACLVKRDGKYLMVRENPEGKVVYNLPAGHVDKGEAIEAAAVRETKEETGYDVRLLEHIAIYHQSGDASVKHVYSAEITGGESHPQEGEIMEVCWLPYDEIATLYENNELRKPWVWDCIAKYETPEYRPADSRVSHKSPRV